MTIRKYFKLHLRKLKLANTVIIASSTSMNMYRLNVVSVELLSFQKLYISLPFLTQDKSNNSPGVPKNKLFH